MADAPLTVWSWNLDGRANAAAIDRQVAAIAEHRPHLLLAQEVAVGRMWRLEEHFDWVVHSTPDVTGRRRHYGTAVFGRDPIDLDAGMCTAPEVFGLPDGMSWLAVKFARYATWAQVRIAGVGSVLAGSLHAKPAAGEADRHKPFFHAGIDRWLTGQELPWVFGIDANTPAADHHDEALVDWCWPMTDDWPGEDQLLGVHRRNRGRDLLRDVLPADAPRPWSHELRWGRVRYDHLWATSEFQPLAVEYWTDLLDASDHAPVVATVRVLSRGGPPRTTSRGS